MGLFKQNKFSNKKTQVDGIMFDSKAEANRYCELVFLQKAGIISNLRLQVPFVLAPAVKYNGAKRATPALRYVADFVYTVKFGEVVEDVKGVLTKEFAIKRHLMMSVHGIDIKLISVSGD